MEGRVLLQAVAQLWKGVYCCKQWHSYGSVLLQAVAQLWKGVYCCKQWHTYGMECTVASNDTIMEGSVLLQAVA